MKVINLASIDSLKLISKTFHKKGEQLLSIGQALQLFQLIELCQRKD